MFKKLFLFLSLTVLFASCSTLNTTTANKAPISKEEKEILEIKKKSILVFFHNQMVFREYNTSIFKDVPAEKIEVAYDKVMTIQKNGFQSNYKEYQIKEMVSICKGMGMNGYGRDILEMYGMLKSRSDEK